MTLTADIVAAHVANNPVPIAEIGGLIACVYDALAGLGEEAVSETDVPLKPAVSIRASVKPGHIVCLENCKKMKMLKRHLMTDHGMTPADYRAKWNLPSDYPMVAPDYAEARRGLAVKIGLGRKRKAGAKPEAKPATPAAAPKARRGRPPKTA